jgi:pyruvate,orthophosphate dikinase
MRDLRRRDTTSTVRAIGRGPAGRALLGTDGSGLARLGELGLRTPPGITISTEGWRARDANGEPPDALWAEVGRCLPGLADEALRVLGRPGRGPSSRSASYDGVGLPPLLTVRASAPAHVPGLLRPVVGIGIGEATLGAVEAVAGPAFAARRWLAFLRDFGSEVRGLPLAGLDAETCEHPEPLRAARALRDLIAARSGAAVPDDLEGQLRETIVAAWDSWDRPEAAAHRRRARLSDDLGVAVVVQATVHGDLDDDSGVGTAFSRDPTTGSPSASGRFLPHASGGVGGDHHLSLVAMGARLPTPLAELDAALPLVEAAYRDMCAVDFAVQSGRLWFLGAEPGARSGPAAVRIAVDLVDDGLIAPLEALERIPLPAVARLQAPVLARGPHVGTPSVRGPASPGADATRMVPAQPDVRIARVLQWADERRVVELLTSAPSGAVLVHGPADVPAVVDGPVVVDVPPDADGGAAELRRTVSALADAGARSLVLRVVDGPGLGAVPPPAGPWTAIVADRDSWAARLLAGRLDVVEWD